jgi:hypothetical protein
MYNFYIYIYIYTKSIIDYENSQFNTMNKSDQNTYDDDDDTQAPTLSAAGQSSSAFQMEKPRAAWTPPTKKQNDVSKLVGSLETLVKHVLEKDKLNPKSDAHENAINDLKSQVSSMQSTLDRILQHLQENS